MGRYLRDKQSLIDQMGWVFKRPSLTAIEVGWRVLFGVPLVTVCWIEAQRSLAVLPLDATGLTVIDSRTGGLRSCKLLTHGRVTSRTWWPC